MFVSALVLCTWELSNNKRLTRKPTVATYKQRQAKPCKSNGTPGMTAGQKTSSCQDLTTNELLVLMSPALSPSIAKTSVACRQALFPLEFPVFPDNLNLKSCCVHASVHFLEAHLLRDATMDRGH
jgi:hypothetical protein